MIEYQIPGLDYRGECFAPDPEQLSTMLQELKSFKPEWCKEMRISHVWWFQISYNKYCRIIQCARDIYTRDNLERSLNDIIQCLPRLYRQAYRTQYDWKNDYERKKHEEYFNFFVEKVKDAYALAVCIQCYDRILKSST